MTLQKKVNFTIIAHVDHGKSTLSDRILEICNLTTLKKERVLDSMDLEKEKGITIKSQTVRLTYKKTILNLVDTPGHFDFSYEVKRSLGACNISLLLIDATQGVQAQTVAHLGKARDENHLIIPVINKIDLPSANVERCKRELAGINVNINDVKYISAKTGDGVNELLDYLITFAKEPIDLEDHVNALIIDSWYDQYRGVILLVHVKSGTIKKGMSLKAYHAKIKFMVRDMGYFVPQKIPINQAVTGDIAFIVTGKKDPVFVPGDHILDLENNKDIEVSTMAKPIIFRTMYFRNPDIRDKAADILKKYQLNDPAFTFSMTYNSVRGTGFNCGFLGQLHCEIVKERIRRNFGIEIDISVPSVMYHVYKSPHEYMPIVDHDQIPNSSDIYDIQEPYVEVKIYLNETDDVEKKKEDIRQLCRENRSEKKIICEQSAGLHTITCEMPLIEVITKFNSTLKSRSSGYASMKYELCYYKSTEITKLIPLFGPKGKKRGEPLNNFGILTHVDRSYHIALSFLDQLKGEISRSQIAMRIQIASYSINHKNRCQITSLNQIKSHKKISIKKSSEILSGAILASATISAYRKDVTSGCYGGDQTRKDKKLKIQAKGKKKLIERYKSNNKNVVSRDILFRAAYKAVV